jgi:D-3-phosphoglycerate dehydrogenase
MKKQKPLVWILDDEWTDHGLEKEIYEMHGLEMRVTRSETLTVDLPKYAPYADGVVAQVGFPCQADLIRELDSCKVIAISGVGYNHVDLDAATDKGIYVANIPDYCTDEVSDFTIALMLNITRRLGTYFETVKRGYWNPLAVLPIYRLREQTIGLLGYGRIGSRVAEKLKPFGARIIACDINPSVFKKADVIPVTLEELLSQANILSLHVPITPLTDNLLTRNYLGRLPQGAYIINTSRGGIINEKDLQELLEEGRLAGAA